MTFLLSLLPFFSLLCVYLTCLSNSIFIHSSPVHNTAALVLISDPQSMFSHPKLLDQFFCQCKQITSSRIVGGKISSYNIPWQVSIQFNSEHNCGGIILNINQVLTAAHCVFGFDLSELSVVAGIHDLTDPQASLNTFHVKQVLVNYLYKSDHEIGKPGDIAVITIDGKFDFSNMFIKPACIDKNKKRYYNEVMASGWGFTHPKIVSNGKEEKNTISKLLKVALFKFQKPEEAAEEMDKHCLSDHLICLKSEQYGDSTCNGDSGGPLHSEFEEEILDSNRKISFETQLKSGLAVIGVDSYGIGRLKRSNVIENCIGKAIFERIAYYEDFFNQHVGRDNICWVDAIPLQ